MNKSATFLFFVFVFFSCSRTEEKSDSQKPEENKKYSFQVFSPEELKADLKDLYNKLDTVHYNLYHAYKKPAFDSVYQSIDQKLSRPMNAMEFYLHILPLFNLLEDAQTMAVFPLYYSMEYSKQEGKFLPLKVMVQRRKIYIVEDYSGKKVPLFAEIKSINGKPSVDIIKDLHLLVNPENKTAEDDFISYFLPRMLYPLYGYDKIYKLEIMTHKLEEKALVLDGISLEKFPEKIEDDYSFYSLDSVTGVMDINACKSEQAFGAFCDSVFGLLRKNNCQNLIIDLRDNAGGSNFHGDTLLTYLSDKFTQHEKAGIKFSKPVYADADSIYFKIYEKSKLKKVDNSLRFAGKVFMVTNINTFSSAGLMAATFKCFKMGTLVGQETGGTQIYFDEPVMFTLKNSGQAFLVSHQIRWSPCSFTNERGTIPDFIVPFNLNNKVLEIDSEIEFIKGLIKKEL